MVLVPARMSTADEQHWVRQMVERVTAREQAAAGSGARTSDAALMARARELADRYLQSGGYPASIRWVGTMRTRWASCTPADGAIRVSDRLREVPSWVLDYVLVHELAHLQVPGHNADFWALVNRFPRTERARGYLDGVSAAAALPIAPDLAGDEIAGDELTEDELAG